MKKNILLIAAHVDDVELAAGASVVKWVREGNDVRYMCFSSAQRSNPGFDMLKESHSAMNALGVHQWYMSKNIPVRRFPERRQEVLDVLKGLEWKPDLIVAPGTSDRHQDHTTVAAEVVRAFPTTSLLTYSHPWNSKVYDFNHFVQFDEEHLNRKLDALSYYESQKSRRYFDPEFIWVMARWWGFASGGVFAEAFHYFRGIE